MKFLYSTIPSCIALALIASNPFAAISGEDPEASKLLKDARAARANWSDFPGFTAEITVNDNGKVYQAKVAVNSKGEVRIDGLPKGSLLSQVRRQLSSLVMHRIGNAANRNTPCAFADENTDHPLGRKIRVLNDELHSSYRIRDRQILEVNRTMKNMRFTISVLKNYETPEKTFLPAAYVVHFWDGKSGRLLRSVTHYNTWQRVGRFDLPKLVMIVTGTPSRDSSTTSPVNVLTIQFGNYRLSK